MEPLTIGDVIASLKTHYPGRLDEIGHLEATLGMVAYDISLDTTDIPLETVREKASTARALFAMGVTVGLCISNLETGEAVCKILAPAEIRSKLTAWHAAYARVQAAGPLEAP